MGTLFAIDAEKKEFTFKCLSPFHIALCPVHLQTQIGGYIVTIVPNIPGCAVHD